MLHKGKLQAALNFKRGQFTAYDSSFLDQLQAYRHALETLYLRYPSAAQLDHVLPPHGSGMPPAGARSTNDFDRWLVKTELNPYHRQYFPFVPELAKHAYALSCTN